MYDIIRLISCHEQTPSTLGILSLFVNPWASRTLF